ncbi:DsbA family oxidoreductase [Thalassoglobus polymorphus]|uniref:DSBA-like thioredoxin domain protein n=1 Tax=Thalassoglobus polymorphus TaxID=2527994 RepID=A0A517QNK9_9PLAN|nr:DsbA family oxidoreductase [Thalassoglobus polymorphus]QDT33220.1 DSBA-like thioredoxin domain protein [Thalassoglobus polymorphus]
MKLFVDVISDVICPWCYIGKRRLEKAIAALSTQHEVQVRWHPFQLNPTMPKEGISRKDYRTQKFGSWERSVKLDATVTSAGEAEGIRFDFDKIERTPNTVDAHRLIWLADQHGCQDAVVEALFRAYFSEGQDIGNRQTIINIVAAAGLEREAAETMLDREEGMEMIAQAAEMSQQYQVSSVPFFILNQKLGLSGAQHPEKFLNAFKQLTDRSTSG